MNYEQKAAFYSKEFFRFEEGKSRESQQLDKAIFWADTGTLVLSVNYIVALRDIKLIYPYLLIFSWISLLSSMLAYVLAYHYSKRFHERILEELSNWFQSPDPALTYFEKSDAATNLEILVKKLTNFSLWSLISGLVLITCFAALNFLKLNSICI